MKKYLIFLLVSVFAVGALAYAEEGSTDGRPNKDAFQPPFEVNKVFGQDSTSEDREAFRKALEERRAAFIEEMKKRKEDFRKSNLEDKLKFWNGAKRMLGERFTVAVRNMERLQGRVEEIIDALEVDGEDTSDAEEYLNLSIEKLGDAKDKIAEIQALVPDQGEAVTPEIFEQIKVKAREAKDLLKESHEALKNAVREIKELKNMDDDSDEDAESEDEEEDE